jgi:hypothetical protein
MASFIQEPPLRPYATTPFVQALVAWLIRLIDILDQRALFRAKRAIFSVTVAAAATSGSANHGLNAAPARVSVTPKADIGAGNRFWATVSATQVTVTLAAGAPVGGVGFDIVAWED